MMTIPSNADLLTVEQFAAKMQVSRTTVFEWLKTGNVEEGKHYFKIGRVIRFVWDTSLFLVSRKKRPAEKTSSPTRPKDKRRLRPPSQSAVNLDY